MTKKSPLAPEAFPKLPIIDGVTFAVDNSGIKYKNRPDLMLAHLQPGTTVAGVFTTSSTRSAPVLDCQRKLGSGTTGASAFFVNAGNSNAFTGNAGEKSVEALTKAVASALSISENSVYSASTGVIGERLPHEKIISKIDDLAQKLQPDTIDQAAAAILTTDTFPKGSTRQCRIDGKDVKIAAIAKGSGMIAPDLATMLVFIFTDAAVAQPVLQQYLVDLNQSSFNAITVDSDTSTSDTVLLAATGASEVKVESNNAEFSRALGQVMQDLAHQIVKDGEGASKFIEVRVSGAKTDQDAKTHALSIANSPLVKTAAAGEDPNWGRVVMAIGKSGAYADRDLLTIKFGDITVAENGWVSPTYSEELGSNYMKNDELLIHVNLGLGDGESRVWTCDLTHGYISINADYRS